MRKAPGAKADYREGTCGAAARPYARMRTRGCPALATLKTAVPIFTRQRVTAMSRTAATALLTLAALAFAFPAAATQWKWREGGRVIYSDRPPPTSIPEREILQRPTGMARGAVPPSPTGPSLVSASPSSATPAASGAHTDTDLEARARKEAARKAQAQSAQQKAEEARIAAARADNCLRARSQLKMLDDGVRIARTNAAGEREILDDKARAGEQTRMRSIIASDCG